MRWVIQMLLCLLGVYLPAQAVGDIPESPYELGGIQIWEKARKIEIKGFVNMSSGLIELLASSKGGKEHESILVLACNPFLFYTALGLIQLLPGRGGQYPGEKAPIYGDPIYIYIAWEKKGMWQKARAENVVWDQKHKQAMPLTTWIFTGSRLRENPATRKPIFMASQNGALVATYYDPDAVVNNPLPERTDDTVYYANTNMLPPKGTPVIAIFSATPLEE